MVISVDQAVTIKTDFKTPFKSNSSALDSLRTRDSSFVADEKSLSPDNTLRIPIKQINLLLLLICTRLHAFGFVAQHSELLRSTVTNLQRSVVDNLNTLGSRVILLHDNIIQDPGIIDFPLHNPWDGLSFPKYSLPDTVCKILPVLKRMTTQLSLRQVYLLVAKYLQFPLTSISSLQAKLLSIDGILSVNSLPLSGYM